MGGAVIDTINNCGWLAGEQIIFSSAGEITDFIRKYAPSLVFRFLSDSMGVTMEYKCSYRTGSNRYIFSPETSTDDYDITI